MLAESGSVLSGRLSGSYRTLMIPLDPWKLGVESSRGTYKVEDRKTRELFDTALDGDRGAAAGELLRRWHVRAQAVGDTQRLALAEQQLAGLEQARLLLESDLSARATLTLVASQVGWHPHHFQRLFRQRYGLTPAQYQRQLRVEEARRRLGRGESASDVATRLGFSDQSHLIGTYRRYYGVTPGSIARTSYSRS